MAVGGTGKYEKKSPLPSNLKRIDVNFKRQHGELHSMDFIGDSTLHIGNVDKFRMIDKDRKGRTETIEMESGEELLGCHIETNETSVYGLTWLKWVPPSRPKAI